MEHNFVQGTFNGEWRCTKCLAASGEFPCGICVLKSTNHARQRFEWTTHALFDRPPIIDNKMSFSLRATRSSSTGPMVGWAVENTDVTARLPELYGIYFSMAHDVTPTILLLVPELLQVSMLLYLVYSNSNNSSIYITLMEPKTHILMLKLATEVSCLMK